MCREFYECFEEVADAADRQAYAAHDEPPVPLPPAAFWSASKAVRVGLLHLKADLCLQCQSGSNIDEAT